MLDQNEMTQLRPITGSLSWVARQGRPELYRVSSLQTAVKGATVATLHEANGVVELAVLYRGINDVRLTFPVGWIECRRVGVLTVTDAFFSGEAGLKSQQGPGRVHFLASIDDMRDIGCTTFKVFPVGLLIDYHQP